MNSLFLDTSHNITYGLMDQNYEWISLNSFENLKTSKEIHSKIEKDLQENDIDISDIKKVFSISGPGSYTGLRVAEGIRDIFNWQGFETYSFNHFQILKILDLKNSTWVCDAYKGEVFIYHNETYKTVSINEYDLTKFDNIYSYKVNESLGATQGTDNLIKLRSKEIFLQVVEQQVSSEVFYFRSINEEYKKSK